MPVTSAKEKILLKWSLFFGYKFPEMIEGLKDDIFLTPVTLVIPRLSTVSMIIAVKRKKRI